MLVHNDYWWQKWSFCRTKHGHDTDLPKALAITVASEVRSQARSEAAVTWEVLGSGLEGISNSALAALPKKSTIERQICRQCLKANMPHAIPKGTTSEIPVEYTDIVLCDTGSDDDKWIIVLGSRDVLDHVTIEEWFGDGTFECSLSIFFQLYAIHCSIGNSYPPFLYFLLPDKQGTTYSQMFKIVTDLLPNSCPGHIWLDFELAAHNGFRKNFPRVSISCSFFFHLRHSVLWQVGALGLMMKHEEDLEVQVNVCSLTSVAFVPPADSAEIFDDLVDEFPDEQEFNDLISYFKFTYIEGPTVCRRTCPAHFTIELNHCEDGLARAPKTTNFTEGDWNVRGTEMSDQPLERSSKALSFQTTYPLATGAVCWCSVSSGRFDCRDRSVAGILTK